MTRGRVLGQGMTFTDLPSPAARTPEDSDIQRGQDFTVGGTGRGGPFMVLWVTQDGLAFGGELVFETESHTMEASFELLM